MLQLRFSLFSKQFITIDNSDFFISQRICYSRENVYMYVCSKYHIRRPVLDLRLMYTCLVLKIYSCFINS